MQLKAHNSQIYQRRKAWYVLFGGISFIIIILSLLNQNYIGVLVMCLFIGGYLFFSVHTGREIYLRTDEAFLYRGDVSHDWKTVQGFYVETNKDKSNTHLTFVIDGVNYTHTLCDDPNATQSFLLALTDRLPLLQHIQYSSSEKLAKELKL